MIAGLRQNPRRLSHSYTPKPFADWHDSCMLGGM